MSLLQTHLMLGRHLNEAIMTLYETANVAIYLRGFLSEY